MIIQTENLGKRYNREWIFRRFSYTFASGKKYAITGNNGSGKSTLLQVLSGAVLHNEGTVSYDGSPENFHTHIAIAAPYLELVEEMTATEMLAFHATFKKLSGKIPQILETVQLKQAAHKQIRYFSSGMKQRLKLAQAFYSETPVLLLDEPTTNLDAAGIALYHTLMQQCAGERLVIISSNDQQEYAGCDAVIAIGDYKIS